MKKLFAAFAVATLTLALCPMAFTAQTPEPAAENGIITPEEWEPIFPEIVASYQQNGENSYVVSYLEEDPYLVNIYEGYGFAKDYGSARGHYYCLEDVYATERPHALANCLTCKTADFTKMVNDIGEEVYSYDFAEVYDGMNESMGCYNCHANEEANGGLVVTHSYVTMALGEEYDGINPEILSCGQCHIEYYFDPETKAARMPHSDVATMTPEATLAYYDEIGFSDWTQESTGAKMLKAQHPEMETYLAEGSFHNRMGLTCADCHMGSATTEDGVTFSNHYWRSPLADDDLLATCAQCHGDTDMAEKVHAIQEEITAEEKRVGERLSALKTSLAELVAAGNVPEEQLDEIRTLYRNAQWYWDYCYVENSEGAHNSTFAKNCLSTSDGIIEEAEAKIAEL